MITQLKKTSAMLAVCLLLGGVGLVSGNAVQDAVSPTPVAAYCPDDICIQQTSCLPSNDTDTLCDFLDNGECQTLLCGSVGEG